MHAELEETSINFLVPDSSIEIMMNIKITKALSAEKPRIKLVLPTSWTFEDSKFYGTVLAHKRYNEMSPNSTEREFYR